MDKLKKYIIVLLILIALLILVDILSGIWCWNRLNLLFDFEVFKEVASLFSNIALPIISAVAIFIYYQALKESQKQNNILRSQNLKPYFDAKLLKLKKDAESEKIECQFINDTQPSSKKYNILEYSQGISDCVSYLIKDKDYYHYWKRISDGEKVDYEEISTFPFYPTLFSLEGLLLAFNYSFFLSRIETIIIEIEKSRLTETDKEAYVKSIFEEYLNSYLSIIDLSKASYGKDPYSFISRMNRDFSSDVKIKHLSDTYFVKNEEWIRNKFNK